MSTLNSKVELQEYVMRVLSFSKATAFAIHMLFMYNLCKPVSYAVFL